MRIAQFEFSPPWWAALLFLAVLALLVSLGSWQLRRGHAKEAIIAERVAAGKMPPLDFQAALDGTAGARRVKLQGEYLPDRQLLLDNQVWRGRVGYRVWTPLRRDNGELVLVDRGWVALGEDRAQPPSPAAPPGRQTVVGFFRPWPKPGLQLAAGDCGQDGWPRVVLYPQWPRVACNYAAPVADGLLLLEEAADGGFARDWQDLGLPPLRHYGYALQWYALSLTLCVIFIAMNTQKIRPKKYEHL